MKAKLLAFAVVCAGGALVSQPAAACSPIIDQQILHLENPRELGISEQERERRWAAYRAWLADAPARKRAEWAEDARQLVAADIQYQAEVLVETLLPSVVEVDRLGSRPCSYLRDLPLEDDRLFARLDLEIRNAPSLRPEATISQDSDLIEVVAVRRPGAFDGFDVRYASVVGKCSREVRDRVVARILPRLGPDHVSAVLVRIAEHGLIRWGPSPVPLMRFAADDPTQLELGERRRPWSLYDGYQDSAAIAFYDTIAASEWEGASTYLQEDAQARAVISAIEMAMADMRDESQTFDGLCPLTVSELHRVVETWLEAKQLASGPWVDELLRY